ncbi:Sec1 family [Babesia microti strain RI]|uniref:Sec1 family n=1 Tax=Babesia microti (strain RI) TaxID=1133968 RepID=I7IS95_BABMR|nr:Sec1 family [Babesia microti strain RI]CCF75446.1 Sec1 family [Babesia microti strain RI]|eukprot:XP_012649854.1 Sec1 family [Babesia microti strain RI]
MSWIISQVRQNGCHAFENAIFEIISHIIIPYNTSADNVTPSANLMQKVIPDTPELIYNKIFLACSHDVYSILALLYKKNAWPPLGVADIREFGYDTVPNGVELIIYLTRPTFESTDEIKSQIYNDFSIKDDEQESGNDKNSLIKSATKTISSAFDYSLNANEAKKRVYGCAIIAIPDISPSFKDLLLLNMGQHFQFQYIKHVKSTNLLKHDLNDKSSYKHEIIVSSCELYWCAIGDDIISMEMEDAFSDFYLFNDSILPKIACDSIMKLQESILKGSIGKIRAIGEAGKIITDLLVSSRRRKTECIRTRSVKSDKLEHICAVPIRHFTSLDHSQSSELNVHSPNLYNISQKVNHLVIFDRRIDYYSLLCTSSSYLGLLDSFWSIEYESVTVPQDVVKGVSKKNYLPEWLEGYQSLLNPGEIDTTTVSLSSQNGIFKEIRDLAYDDIGNHLHKKANEIQKMYQEKEDMKTISEMAKFMNKFKQLQREHSSLATHINIASHLCKMINNTINQKILKIEYDITRAKFDKHNAGLLRVISNKQTVHELLEQIEDMVNYRVNIIDIYRLLCLLTLVYPMFSGKELYSVKRAIIQQYGFGEYYRLSNLTTVGLLKSSDTSNDNICTNDSIFRSRIGLTPFNSDRDEHQWEKLRNKLNLIIDNENARKDFIYSFSGYVPLTVRLLQFLHTSPQGWQDIKETLFYIDGPVVQIDLDDSQRQNFDSKKHPIGKLEQLKDTVKQIRGSFEKASENVIMEKESRLNLVFYYGGITYSEISAIRKLNEMRNQKEKYLIVTTSIINAKKIYNQLRKVTI